MKRATELPEPAAVATDDATQIEFMTRSLIASGSVMGSAVRFADSNIYFYTLPSDESLGYFQSSAKRTKFR